MTRELVQTSRPPICTGITPSGWLTWRSGDVILNTYKTSDGQFEHETVPAGSQ